MPIFRLAVAVLSCLFAAFAHADPPRVEAFAPQGTAKRVHQASARFSVPMVPFGEPRLSDPFDVSCAAKGTGRWIDDRNWAYDFGRELPAGLRCAFTLRSDLVDVAGQPVTRRASRSRPAGPR